MVIEGRTISTLEELREFCDAAIAASKVDPARIRLTRLLCLRVISDDDDRRDYDLEAF